MNFKTPPHSFYWMVIKFMTPLSTRQEWILEIKFQNIAHKILYFEIHIQWSNWIYQNVKHSNNRFILERDEWKCVTRWIGTTYRAPFVLDSPKSVCGHSVHFAKVTKTRCFLFFFPKCCSSCSFHSISSKLYKDIGIYVGQWPLILKSWHLSQYNIK